MLREAPKGVPAAVVAAAHEIDANLAKPEDKALLLRLLEHPDMSSVWRQLGKRANADEPTLAGFFKSVFQAARAPRSVVTESLARSESARWAALAEQLREGSADLSGATVASPGLLHQAAVLATAADICADIARDLTMAGAGDLPGVAPLLVKRERGNLRTRPLGLAIVAICGSLFSARMFSVAATLTNVALNLRGNDKIGPDTLRKAQDRT